MYDRSDAPSSSPPDAPGVEGGDGRNTATSVYGPWQAAQERVLSYLKALGVPPFQSLQIAHAALRVAVANRSGGPADLPTQLAMRALHSILVRDHHLPGQSAYKAYPALYRRWLGNDHPGRSAVATSSGPTSGPSAAPAICRGSMPTKTIRRLSLLSLAVRLFDRCKGTHGSNL